MTTEPTTELTTEATTEATVGTDDQPDTEFDTTRPGFDTSEALSTLDQLGELAWADPAELVLEVNTRTSVPRSATAGCASRSASTDATTATATGSACWSCVRASVAP